MRFKSSKKFACLFQALKSFYRAQRTGLSWIRPKTPPKIITKPRGVFIHSAAWLNRNKGEKCATLAPKSIQDHKKIVIGFLFNNGCVRNLMT